MVAICNGTSGKMKENEIYEIYYRRYPYPFRFGSYHAILRSLTIATLVERLYESSRLSNETYERLLRTRQLIRVLIYYGTNSEEASRAIDTINQAHAYVVTSNDDYLFVLSTFFLEPLRWNKEYGKKPINDNDLQLIIEFWSEIGRRMNIENMPQGLDQWLQFQEDYENRFAAYSDAGNKLAMSSLNKLCSQAIPFGLRTIAKQLLLGTVDKKVSNCLRLSTPLLPPKILTRLINQLQPSFEPKRDIVKSWVNER